MKIHAKSNLCTIKCSKQTAQDQARAGAGSGCRKHRDDIGKWRRNAKQRAKRKAMQENELEMSRIDVNRISTPLLIRMLLVALLRE